MKISKAKQNIIVFILGIIIIIYSISLKDSEAWGLSPALFCLACGILIAVAAPFIKKIDAKKIDRPLQIIFFIALMFAYGALLTRFNFLIITPIFLILIIMAFSKKINADTVIYSIVIAVLIYVIFKMGFGIVL